MLNSWKHLLKSPLAMVWLETFVRFGTGLIVLPIAVVKLSDAEFSIWMVFNTIIGIAHLANIGLGPTLMRATAYFLTGARELPLHFSRDQGVGDGKPNWERVHAVIATSGRIYVFVGLGALLLAGLLGIALIWNLMSMTDHAPRLWGAFAVLAVWSYIQVRIVRWSAILQGLGKVTVAKHIGILIGALKIATFSIVLWLGLGVLGICCAGLIVAALNIFLMRRAVLKNIEGGPIEWSCCDKNLFSQMWPATWRLGLINLGAYCVYYGGGLVVAQLPDVNLIASYLLTLRIVFLIRQIAQAPLAAYMPAVIASLAKRDMVVFRAWTSKIVMIALSIFVFGIVFLLFFGDTALGLLGSAKELLPPEVVLLLALAYLLEMHHSIHATLYIATNHVPFLWPALLSGAGVVGFGFLVVEPYGIYGLVLVQILVQALCNNWLPVYLSLRISNWRFVSYLVSLVRVPLILLVHAGRILCKEKSVSQ